MPIVKKSSEWLIKRMLALGYPVESGICFGMANLGEIAFLLGELGSFDARLTEISERSTSYFRKASQALHQTPLRELDPFITECLYFFDPLSIYQAPESHKELFDIEMHQQHIRQVDWLLPKIMSEKRAECSKFSGVYDLPALKVYLDLIQQTLDEHQILLTSLILECADHALQIGYNSAKKQWTMVEVNHLPTQMIDDTQDLAFKIFASFYDGDEEPSSIRPKEAISIFSTTISVNARENETALHALLQLDRSSQWQALHQPTSEKIATLDSLHCNWLYLACLKGDARTVANLLPKSGVNVNQKNITGNFPLSIACLYGHFEVARMLLSHPHIDPKVTTNNGSTALLLACQHGHNDIIQLFGAQPTIKTLLNSRDTDGFSPLDCAVREGNVDLVRLLRSMDETLDINYRDEDNESVLFIACRSGNINLLLALSEFANVDYQLANQFGITPFMAACKSGHLMVAQWLVEQQQVDTSGIDANGNDALMSAVEANQADIFYYLLSLPQLNLNRQDKNDDTAYTLACEQGNTDFACALINSGCNIALTNIQDETGFDILIRKNEWQKLFTILQAARSHHPNPKQLLSKESRIALIAELQKLDQHQRVSASSNSMFAPQRRPAVQTDDELMQPSKRTCVEETPAHQTPS